METQHICNIHSHSHRLFIVGKLCVEELRDMNRFIPTLLETLTAFIFLSLY